MEIVDTEGHNTSKHRRSYRWLVSPEAPFTIKWFNFNPAYIQYKVWDEITYQFINFTGSALEI